MENPKDKQMETEGLLKGLYRGDVGSLLRFCSPRHLLYIHSARVSQAALALAKPNLLVLKGSGGVHCYLTPGAQG